MYKPENGICIYTSQTETIPTVDLLAKRRKTVGIFKYRMAYKSMEEIVENIEPTAEILCRIKPIYNFKAAE